MREAVYLILALAVTGTASATESSPKPDMSVARYHSAALRLDLRTSAVLSWSATPPRLETLAAQREVLFDARPPALPPAGRGVLAWALPAGLDFFATSAFGQTTLLGQAAWPTGATVPTVRTSAAIAFDLDDVAGTPLRLNLSVNRNWQLDGPIGGTFPDCAVRLDLAAEAAPKIYFQAPCGATGHFGVGIRGRF